VPGGRGVGRGARVAGAGWRGAGHHQQAPAQPFSTRRGPLRAPKKGSVALPGFWRHTLGSGAIMWPPVSVCHQVSTMGLRPSPTMSWYLGVGVGVGEGVQVGEGWGWEWGQTGTGGCWLRRCQETWGSPAPTKPPSPRSPPWRAPAPRLRVDGLADRAEDAQGVAGVLLDIQVARAHEAADGCGRGVELLHLFGVGGGGGARAWAGWARRCEERGAGERCCAAGAACCRPPGLPSRAKPTPSPLTWYLSTTCQQRSAPG
jgi:hypothetical protein